MNDILRGDIQTTANEIDCAGHWQGPVSEWRAHLVTGHCQFEHCSNLATGTVDFGFFTNMGRRRIGAPMGVCDAHQWILDANRISIQTSPPRRDEDDSMAESR